MYIGKYHRFFIPENKPSHPFFGIERLGKSQAEIIPLAPLERISFVVQQVNEAGIGFQEMGNFFREALQYSI